MAQMAKQTAAMTKNSGTVLPGQSFCSWIEEVQTCIGKAVPMSRLLAVFMGYANLQVDRTVIDETGLKGYYDYSFPVSSDADADPPMKQIEDQLGLRFEPRKVPMKVYVIESAEKPSVDGAEVSAVQAAPSPSQTTPAPTAVSSPASNSALHDMRFDVAVIKPSPPVAHMLTAPHGTAENFSASMATVESMIGFAYDIPFTLGMSMDPAHFFLPHSPNLIGGPAWVTSDKYDLTAKADEATVAAWGKLPEKEQTEELRSMMQALLADRFHLTMRHETREMPVWALTVAKGGPKFGATKEPPAGLNDGEDGTKPYDSSKPYKTRWKLDRGLLEGQDVTMDNFEDMLWGQREIESRKIMDQTGLTGRYDLTLKWASVDDAREPDGPSLFTAIQEQLGLKLESTKAPVDVLVIDHIERPSEN